MSEVSSWTHDVDEIDFVDSDGNPVSTVRAAGGEEVRFDPSVLEEAVARTVSELHLCAALTKAGHPCKNIVRTDRCHVIGMQSR